ncbi:MAG: helix-turn-helix domain-containing protein [Actinobacteria bacterium]|nr:helix-turn-helix domain-containing protein [Actinomycetota bacterium]MBU1942716.1 helix-turn-helix domain-containing protein [Actinomycetota bacterium]MBU2686038.1 helix-turn-helix domain-containing protein [Actinomycetota bacterium]
MIEQLRRGKVSLPPLSFRFLEGVPKAGGNRRFDALVEALWRDKTAKFAVECKSLSTPKAFQDGLNLLKTSSLPKSCKPLLFLPFLSEQQLQELEQEGISGIDLCGNGVVVAPGEYAVFRSGEKNRFTSSAPIKNIYRKNSSMVARVFLGRPSYNAVQEIRSEINRRNMLVNRWDKKPMSLSTVSKALKTLEEDLIITRKDTIRLLQPDKLLDNLDDNYAPPTIKERVRLKVPQERDAIRELLIKLSQTLEMPLVVTGASSVGRYTVMQRGDLLSFYCPRLEKLLERLPGNQTDRFPNLELVETEDETVYFDARQEGDFWWASPVQVYLELMAGDKRDRETAEQMKSYILNYLQMVQQ